MEILRERNIDLYKTYEEPEFDKEGKLIKKKLAKKMAKQQKEEGDDSKDNENSRLDDFDVSLADDLDMVEDLRKEMDLPDGVLVTNLFIPVTVVCSKIDLIERQDMKNILETNLDFIQYSLRKFCIQYGAALVFASSKTDQPLSSNDSNIKLLYDYILARIFDLDFSYPSNIVQKETMFIPTGFDSPELIEQTDLRYYKDIMRRQNPQAPEIEQVDI